MSSLERVTILIYTFPKPGSEDVAFAKIVASIEQTWKFVGRLKTVIVASQHFSEVDAFAAAHYDCFSFFNELDLLELRSK